MRPDDVTFLVIAQNEQANIARAIESCRGLGSVLVVDGGSTDDTVAIARGLGARVVTNPFTYHAAQYNFGLDRVETSWAFVLDADERVGETLAQSLSAYTPEPAVVAAEVDRANYLFGAPIRHSGWSPDLNVRLLRVDKCRYDDRAVHARVRADGVVGSLAGQLHHYTYGSVEHYLTKLNAYTSFEVTARDGAQEVLDARSRWRSRYLKLPFKPTARFIYMYFVRRGFLDGRRGWDLARLSSFYETAVSMKRRYGVATTVTDEPERYP